MRDLTRKQFEAALKRHGFIRRTGVLGYWVHESGVSISEYVYYREDGDKLVMAKRRERLAHMIQRGDRNAKRKAS